MPIQASYYKPWPYIGLTGFIPTSGGQGYTLNDVRLTVDDAIALRDALNDAIQAALEQEGNAQ